MPALRRMTIAFPEIGSPRWSPATTGSSDATTFSPEAQTRLPDPR